MNDRRRTLILAVALALAAAGWTATAALQDSIDRVKGSYLQSDDTLWVSSPKVIRLLSFGQEGLLADIYWTRAVQYYGSRLRDRKTEFPLLAPLLNITVTLDPQMLLAYDFGAFFLAERPPHGAGEPEQAIQLLERGIRTLPNEWRFWHYLGFIYYWDLHDYSKAAAAYQEGAKNPKARDFMKVMAAQILQKGGNTQTSQFLWSEIYRSSDDPTIKENAQRHLQALQAQADVDELEKRVQLFHDRNGSWPRSLQELLDQHLLDGLPVDPAGFPYQLQLGGKVVLSPKSTVTLDAPSIPESPSSAQALAKDHF